MGFSGFPEELIKLVKYAEDTIHIFPAHDTYSFPERGWGESVVINASKRLLYSGPVRKADSRTAHTPVENTLNHKKHCCRDHKGTECPSLSGANRPLSTGPLD